MLRPALPPTFATARLFRLIGDGGGGVVGGGTGSLCSSGILASAIFFTLGLGPGCGGTCLRLHCCVQGLGGNQCGSGGSMLRLVLDIGEVVTCAGRLSARVVLRGATLQ